MRVRSLSEQNFFEAIKVTKAANQHSNCNFRQRIAEEKFSIYRKVIGKTISVANETKATRIFQSSDKRFQEILNPERLSLKNCLVELYAKLRVKASECVVERIRFSWTRKISRINSLKLSGTFWKRRSFFR